MSATQISFGAFAILQNEAFYSHLASVSGEVYESTPATPAASSAGLVAHAKGAQECPRRYWVDVTSRHGAYSVSCQSEFEATRVRRHLACIRGIRAGVCSAPVEVAA